MRNHSSISGDNNTRQRSRTRHFCGSLLLLSVFGCGTTIEIPAVNFQLPGAQVSVPVPSLKLPDVNARELIAKVDAARAKGGVPALKAEANALKTMFASEGANEFLGAVESLPSIAVRTLYTNEAERKWFTKKEFDAAPRSVQSNLRVVEISEERYYVGNKQTPLVHARMLDIANLYGLTTLSNARVLDIGYGAIGAPRLLAAAGSTVVALDNDAMLPALYQVSGDTGSVSGVGARRGTLALAHGNFPADTSTQSTVGSALDLILSRDVFTKSRASLDGEAATPQRLRVLAEAMKPGAIFVIYNVARPGARDGRVAANEANVSITLEDLQAAGFKVLAYNQNDDGAIRQMGQLLGWDKRIGDLERSLFARYTVLKK